ncbi:hypothetical protein ABXV18_26900 [Vibrio owensii]
MNLDTFATIIGSIIGIVFGSLVLLAALDLFFIDGIMTEVFYSIRRTLGV